MITIKATLQQGLQELSSVSDTPRLDAEILLAKILDVDRAYLYSESSFILSPHALEQWHELLRRRKQGEPIAYILGKQEFWSLELITTPATLIPRPETEVLVEIALKKLAAVSSDSFNPSSIAVADLGTGTGAIALALASEHPEWKIVATDQSSEALAIAKLNAKQLGINNVEFYQGSWCFALTHHQFTAIISNPPYIAEHDVHLSQGDLPYEPKSALVSGEDGLAAIREIIEQARDYLRPGGWLMLEHGYDQQEKVIHLMEQSGYVEVEGYADLANVPRVVAGRSKPSSFLT